MAKRKIKKLFANKKNLTVIIIATLVLLGAAGFVFTRVLHKDSCAPDDALCMVNPAVLENDADRRIVLADLRSQILKYISEQNISEGVSLYYVDLNSGRRITYRGASQLLAASLMKLPIAMNAFAMVEDGFIDLDDTMILTEKYYDSAFTSFKKEDIGKQYTIGELIRIMLVESDNTAMNMVSSYIENHSSYGKRDVLQELDILYNFNQTQTGILIGAREYASFLGCLYGACFLTPQYSGQILLYLEASTFKGPMREALPSELRVAHKFGVYGDEAFNDCGIVYDPSYPFSLCFMSTLSTEEAVPYVRDLTKMIYNYVKHLDD